MAGSDRDQDAQKPSEQRGGTTPDEAELGGSDAPREMLAEDPELGSSVLGQTTGSDEPATDGGIDLSAGDHADAVTDGGPDVPADAEPDVKDVRAAAREPERD